MNNSIVRCSVAISILFYLATSVAAMDANLEKFLDSSISNQARVQAGNAVGLLQDDEITKLETFVQDATQNEILRSIALSKLGENDPERAIRLAIETLKDKGNGGPRYRAHATSYLTTAIQFGKGQRPEYRQPATALLRELLSTDEEESVRQASISYLGKIGDPVAEERLKQALRDPDGALVSQEKAIGYVSAYDPRTYESELSAILEKPKNPRVEAKVVEALASNPKYHAAIKDKLTSQESPLEVRIAAAESLTRYLPEAVSEVLRIAVDKTEPAALRSSCLYNVSGAATRARGNAGLWQKFGVGEEEVEEQVQNLLKTGAMPEQVKNAAQSYINQHLNK